MKANQNGEGGLAVKVPDIRVVTDQNHTSDLEETYQIGQFS